MSSLFSLIGFLGVIVAGVFVALKIAGLFPHGWLVVVSPLFVDVALFVGLVVVGALGRGTGERLGDVGAFFGRRARMRRVMEQAATRPDRPSDSGHYWD